MKRKVYLKGELANLYGSELTMDIERAAEVFSCLEANFGGVKKYLIDAHEKNVGFTVFVADENIEKEEDLLLSMKEGDVVISPVPAGSSGGGGKILAAAAIAAFLLFPPLGTAGGAPVYTLLTTQIGGAAAVAANMALGLAVNLALTGIQELMAPDPSVEESPESYIFNGSQQNIVSGDPVPVLYGQLRVPGQPISFEVLNRQLPEEESLTTNVSTSSSSAGNGRVGGTASDTVITQSV